MKKKIEFKIPIPCREDWQSMSPVEKGRYCGSCQKTVTDFTHMSDTEILAFFRKKTKESVCGRMRSDQLNRSMELPRKRIPWLKYFFQITIPAFLWGKEAVAQGAVSKIVPEVNVANYQTKGRVLAAKPTPAPTVIKGCITDSQGNGIAFSSIMIKGTNQGTAADGKGDFLLSLSGPKTKSLTLVISSIGYETTEILVEMDSTKAVTEINIGMTEMNEVFSGEMIVMVGAISPVYEVPRDTLVYEKEVEDLNSTLSIFPNPVAGGSPVRIKVKDLPASVYLIQFLKMDGTIVREFSQRLAEGAQSIEMNVPAIAPGTYLIVLSAKTENIRKTARVLLR